MSNSIVQGKAEALSARIFKMSAYIRKNHQEYIMTKQIQRSGTSVSANITEALQGQSKADFVHKMQIALKEASETKYWLRMFRKTELLTEKQFESIYADATEVEKMLTSIIRTTKDNIQSEEEKRKRNS